MFKNIAEMSTQEIEDELKAIEQYELNISNVKVETLLSGKIDTSFLKTLNCSLTPNGQLFRNDRQGFLAEMMEEMYDNRKKFKKLMLEAEKEYENVLKELEKRGIKVE